MPDNLPDEQISDPLFQEEKTSQLLKAALDAPARPLRTDQIEALVGRAANRRDPIPGWLLGLLGLGPLLVLAGLAYTDLSGIRWSGLAEVALIVPLVNLVLSPLAAGLVIYRLVRRNSHAMQEKR